MSEIKGTICDECGETTQEQLPHIGNGTRPAWWRVQVEGKGEAKRDACSERCVVAALRKLADERDVSAPGATSTSPYRKAAT